jgi:hypothetical protein
MSNEFIFLEKVRKILVNKIILIQCYKKVKNFQNILQK